MTKYILTENEIKHNLAKNTVGNKTYVVFFSEENYCRLGKKDYSFTEVYNDLVEKFSKLDLLTIKKWWTK